MNLNVQFWDFQRALIEFCNIFFIIWTSFKWRWCNKYRLIDIYEALNAVSLWHITGCYHGKPFEQIGSEKMVCISRLQATAHCFRPAHIVGFALSEVWAEKKQFNLIKSGIWFIIVQLRQKAWQVTIYFMKCRKPAKCWIPKSSLQLYTTMPVVLRLSTN